MAKSKVTPEEAMQFLESFRLMVAEKDLPTKPISLRVPENLLIALKVLAKDKNTNYQKLIIQSIRNYLHEQKASNSR